MALLLLVIYEASMASLYGTTGLVVRNSAEVMIKRAFWFFGVRYQIALWFVFLALLIGALAMARKQQTLNLKPVYFPLAIFESLTYALFFASLISLFPRTITIKFLWLNGGEVDLSGRMALALGAGIYEELLFRFILLGSLIFLFRYVIGGKPLIHVSLAILISAALFAGFHYLDGSVPLAAESFLFRFYAGVILGIIYHFRGIGIAVYTHAFYDLFLVLKK